MAIRMNTFKKLVILMFLVLFPILLLYSYSNKVSVDVVTEEIQSSNLNRMSFFQYQMDTAIDQLSMSPVIISSDPTIREYIDFPSSSLFERLKTESRVSRKLSLQSVSSGWINDLSIFLPNEKKALSSNIYVSYDDRFVGKNLTQNWVYENRNSSESQDHVFVKQIVNPELANRFEQVSTIFQVSFPDVNIINMLDQFKAGGKGDPFFYDPRYEPIENSTAQQELTQQVLDLIKPKLTDESGKSVISLNRQQYFVTYVKSKNIGWYLVDYVPLQQILHPITSSRNLFYISISLLLGLSVLASLLLYRHVQIPILKLVNSVQRLKMGDFSTRIHYKPNNEFDFLIRRFNDMAEQIQALIDSVYKEKIRSREANLKMLQSQINPHFLYNCLFFIVNTAILKDTKSVVAMAQNLGSYYRYTTRIENQSVPIRDELKLVTNYLVIQNLRLQKIHYDISVPEDMKELFIPRLLLQPLVENAIIHGLEPKIGDGKILIKGEMDQDEYRLIVEDNGVGMPPEELRKLQYEMELPMNEEMGCGVWNVHQRMLYQFGEGAGLIVERSDQGGIKCTLKWKQLPNGGLPELPGGNKR
ncbi:HAMP domain-containing protein [Paenibacillus sp. LMG 31460]|uniref:HAMP domain-containing protein n=1 Tax=Paenibacillus germinis TaxID=2654979 RepID=A0ABX1Z553_9BACL|nr:histidine kinase [Paenibacillus germinis]NOU88391.1 HAMP domain-containing protein [Paenibacillus germinis]